MAGPHFFPQTHALQTAPSYNALRLGQPFLGILGCLTSTPAFGLAHPLLLMWVTLKSLEGKTSSYSFRRLTEDELGPGPAADAPGVCSASGLSSPSPLSTDISVDPV